MSKKILVAYDGSEYTQEILDEAAAQAQGDSENELHLLSIVTGGTTAHRELDQSIQKEMSQTRHDELQKIAENYDESNFHVHYDVIVDNSPRNAGHSIVEYSKEHNFDMIVIGSRGLSNIKSILLGSVSSQVIQHATCNVLIVK